MDDPLLFVFTTCVLASFILLGAGLVRRPWRMRASAGRWSGSTVMIFGRVLCSAVIMAVWGILMLGWAPVPTEGGMRLMDTLMCAVAFYWLGSSSGSDRKTEMLGDSVPSGERARIEKEKANL